MRLGDIFDIFIYFKNMEMSTSDNVDESRLCTPTHASYHSLCSFHLDVKKGEHIAIPFYTKNPLTCSDEIQFHHGIYVCDGFMIDNNSNRSPSIQYISVPVFFKLNNVDPQNYYIIHYNDYDQVKREFAIDVACARLNCEANRAKRVYDAISYNCEGFVTECITGNNRSVFHFLENVFVLPPPSTPKHIF